MGIFDFVRNAGERLFGEAEESEPASESSYEANKARREKAMASAIREALAAHDFAFEGVEVTFDIPDARVTLTGPVPTQEAREKMVLIAGNVHGVAQVDDRLAVDTPEREAVFHTVERGDTLSKIAKEQYGDAMKYPLIFEANRPMLKDPDLIYPGQVLRIPSL